MDASHQKMLDKLESVSGDDFRKLYFADQVSAHKEATPGCRTRLVGSPKRRAARVRDAPSCTSSTQSASRYHPPNSNQAGQITPTGLTRAAATTAVWLPEGEGGKSKRQTLASLSALHQTGRSGIILRGNATPEGAAALTRSSRTAIISQRSIPLLIAVILVR